MEDKKEKSYYFPATRQSLLLSCRSSQSNRWGEFLGRYYSAVEQYVRNHFPDLDLDCQANVVQDVFVELSESLPSFSYDDNPQRKFRWHLIAVIRYKGLEQRRRVQREKNKGVDLQFVESEIFLDDLSHEAVRAGLAESQEEVSMSHVRQDVVDLVVDGLVKDETFSEETRDVFWRIVVNCEKPADIAKEMGVPRDAIDHMKARVMKKFEPCFRRMLKVHGFSE